MLSNVLFKKLTKISPYLYEQNIDTIHVKSDKNSCEKPLMKEKNAEITTNNKIEISKIK